jgi:putative thioredoxin
MESRLDPASMRGAVDLSGLVRQAAGPGAPRSDATPADGGVGVVREADDATFGAVLELSQRVPVIVEFYAAGIEPVLGALIAAYGGRLVLVTVDGNRAPQVAQAFQVQQVPAVAAVVAGRPLQLFVGMPAEAEVRQVLDEVLELAKQQGVTGTVEASSAGVESAESSNEPLPPLHQEAYEAIGRGDFSAAASAYRTALAQNPRDHDAVAGLAQVGLLERLQGAVASELRAAAADRPTDVEAQLALADLDLSGGHVDDAFARLLEVFPILEPDARTAVRTRLLDYFEIVGADDPRTIAARRRLTSLLY